MPTRGFVKWMTAPVSGAPMGVVPSHARAYKLITRPRISWVEWVWRNEFAVVMNEIDKAPVGTRQISAKEKVGI